MIKKLINIEKYTIPQMLLLIAFIIMVLPILLTVPAIFNFLNFSEKGQIGDTIGGITAPFINGLAAILVFLAFKEQIKANEIFKNQEKSKMILDQISLIQEDKMEIEKIIGGIIRNLSYYQSPFNAGNALLLNKLTYFITEIRLTNDLINNYSGDKDFLYKKLHYLYTIKYKDIMNELNKRLHPPFYCHADYTTYIFDIQIAIQEFNTTFNDINKFKVNS
ncbi:MAG: hypothetical protein FGM14_09820 [Flavobacteriales bacterium]|nr:hypothetical protein [Flavobacteriales bacterium]